MYVCVYMWLEHRLLNETALCDFNLFILSPLEHKSNESVCAYVRVLTGIQVSPQIIEHLEQNTQKRHSL